MDDNTVQVVPTYQSGTITVDTDGNILTIPTCVTACDSVGETEVSSTYNTGASNFLSADAMDTSSSGKVQGIADACSFMELYNIKDKDLADAATKAIVEGDMTPLIKEELKYSIQSKRMKAGKPELKVEFKEPEPDQVSS